jgi:hypothetical protein
MGRAGLRYCASLKCLCTTNVVLQRWRSWDSCGGGRVGRGREGRGVEMGMEDLLDVR